MGTSQDSYAVTVGSDGDFTGCIAHLGYVLFFKEDIIHKMYGTKPENFQLSTTHVRGVERGSEQSLAIVNETLYYKSRDGVCGYDGSLPYEVGVPLGPCRVPERMRRRAGAPLLSLHAGPGRPMAPVRL